jgi:hypothetical protein
MHLARYLQHWLSDIGTPLHVTDFVPETDPIAVGGYLSLANAGERHRAKLCPALPQIIRTWPTACADSCLAGPGVAQT